MNQQRKVIYAERRRIPEGEKPHDQALTWSAMSSPPTSTARPAKAAEDWDLDALWTALKTLYPVGTADSLTRKDLTERDDLTREELLEAIH